MKKLILALLLASAPVWAAEESAQTELLRQLFRTPQAQWNATLAEHRDLLDDSFFDRCERRIQWSVEHQHADDALRFALVGDLAAQATGRPAHFQSDLSR